ncbi:MAG: VanW family protein [Clostridia bacterium]|nr:VanW family protein [Clostridia bacterium]
MRKKILFPIAMLLSGIFYIFPMQVRRANGEEVWNTLSSFTTYFNANDVGRCENIRVASELIDGVTLQAYGEFSFNQTVGRRTAESGFKQAKIIVNGEYVLGVGGGVCQVSTTLYNSALLSGLTVTEFHPHSLRVGYVEPSRDAMVSSSSDLKLFNPYPFAVRLFAKAEKQSVCVRFAGQGKGYEYAVVSHVLEETPPPAPIVKDGEEDGVLRAEKNGLKSEAYFETYKNGVLLSRKRLRKDVYLPIQGIVVKKIGNPRD